MFWENHDPTQGMRQGNDVGTQYRSGIYYYDDEQRARRGSVARRFQQQLARRRLRARSRPRFLPAPEFYYAEDYHQQYLAKNPGRLLRPRRHRRQLSGRRQATT